MITKKKKLYLSCLGIVNALGNSKQEVLDNLFRENNEPMTVRKDLSFRGEVKVGAVTGELPVIGSGYEKFESRNNRLLLAAYKQIADEVEELIRRYGKNRIGVVLGSSTSGISDGELSVEEKVKMGSFPAKYHYSQQEMGAVAEFLATYIGLESIAITVSTACSSSAKAFASGRNFIESGFCDAVIVGGVDTLCQLTINGFAALESVSNDLCNPFSRNRDGITIGEGAALFVLTAESSEIELCGVGESSDAYHISAPLADGSGAELAINAALKDANIGASDIDYVNLHGTATIKNDEMESRLMHRVFAESVHCSSTKSVTGHTLGAAGATELGLCWLSLSSLNIQKYLPPHIWDGQQDAALSELSFVKESAIYNAKYMMSNSFAFGGSNASVIIGVA